MHLFHTERCFMAERVGFFLPPLLRFSSQAGRSHCRSPNSLFFRRKRSTRLRIPYSFLFVSFFTIYDIRNTIYEFMADAVATNSNFLSNNRQYQNTVCSPTLFISKAIRKSNPITLARNVLPTNSQKLKHQ